MMVVVGEGPRDGGGETLRREQLLSKLQPLGRERSGCLGHDLHAIGVRSSKNGHLCVLADHDPRGGTEVSELVGVPVRWRVVELILQQVTLQLGVEERDGHTLRGPLLVAGVHDGGAVGCTAAVAVATRVAGPVLAVAAVVVQGKRVRRVQEAGGGGEWGGLGLRGGLAGGGEGLVERGVVHEGAEGRGEIEGRRVAEVEALARYAGRHIHVLLRL